MNPFHPRNILPDNFVNDGKIGKIGGADRPGARPRADSRGRFPSSC